MGVFNYGGNVVKLESIRPLVKRLLGSQERPVIVQGDEGADFGSVLRVVDEAKLAGAQSGSLATEPISQS